MDLCGFEVGLDQPLWRQFVLWLGRLATGDLGTSIFTQVPVQSYSQP